MSCHSLLQGIFLIQGSNPSLLHCRQILLLSEPPRGSQSQSACPFPLSGWPQDRFRPSVALKHHRLKLAPGRAVPPGSVAPKAVLALLLYCKCSKGRIPEPLICNYSGGFQRISSFTSFHSLPIQEVESYSILQERKIISHCFPTGVFVLHLHNNQDISRFSFHTLCEKGLNAFLLQKLKKLNF